MRIAALARAALVRDVRGAGGDGADRPRAGAAIAVLARQTNLAAARTPSRLELNYVEAADDLVAMIVERRVPGRPTPRPGPGAARRASATGCSA